MQRHPPSTTEYRPSVPTPRAAAQHPVLRAGWRDGREPGADEADRPTVHGDALLRQSQDGVRAGHQSQTRAAADAGHGLGGDLSETSDDAAGRRTQDLPVFSAESGDHTT